jgi:hypothetical protein
MESRGVEDEEAALGSTSSRNLKALTWEFRQPSPDVRFGRGERCTFWTADKLWIQGRSLEMLLWMQGIPRISQRWESRRAIFLLIASHPYWDCVVRY